MLELIATIILVGSLMGIVVVLWRKLPLLNQLPMNEMMTGPSFLSKIKNKIHPVRLVKNVPMETLLQKMLSKFRVFAMKTEQKTAVWLQKLREKSARKKKFQNDNYWNKVKENNGQENNNPPGQI